jgi:ABC-type nitrate/sulfonate/bicarbonate transport system substrate-binding protein
MPRNSRLALCALAFAGAFIASAASAQNCPSGMRKINVGVSVTPPNVVHTTPHVAKALGLFAKHCIDATILQFDGGQSPAALAAVNQGTAIANVTDVAIGRGSHAQQIWGFAARMPQSYTVSEQVKTFADLKGKKLSAAGGGVGGYQWRMGREALRKGNLTVSDAQFISQATAGRLAGIVTGIIDGVALHPEDFYLARQQKPGTHVLIEISDLVPDYVYNMYGANTDWLARDRALLRDTIAAMIEANRAIYREKDKVIPIMVKATEKSQEAVEYAWEMNTRNCIWGINEGYDEKRTQWTLDNDVAEGDIDAAKKPTPAQVFNLPFAKEAVEAAGGRTTIGKCTE